MAVARIPFPIAAIADPVLLGDRLVSAVESVVQAGLPWVVLRARSLPREAAVELGICLMDRCPGLFLSMHGDPVACLQVGAPGLHLPSQGVDVPSVRELLPETLLGVSCHDGRELAEAERAKADYAFLSPLFAPVSKPQVRESLGVEGFRNLVRAVRLPVLALGGVTPERLEGAVRAGAAGAAVLGSLFLDPMREATASRYRSGAVELFHHGSSASRKRRES